MIHRRSEHHTNANRHSQIWPDFARRFELGHPCFFGLIRGAPTLMLFFSASTARELWCVWYHDLVMSALPFHHM